MNRVVQCLAVSVAVAVLGGCAAQNEAELATAAPAPAATADDETGELALALARADAADADGDQAALAQAVERIDQLGGKPMAESADDPVPGWRSQIADGLPPMRGRALGPAYRRGALGPNRMIRTEQVFLAGEKARIALESPAGQGMVLRVLDDKDEPVCDAAVSSRRCHWIPIFTQRYRIEVTNRDDSEQRYYLVID